MDVRVICPRLAWLVTVLLAVHTYVEGFNTLCYWTVWSQGRPGNYGLKPGNIDPFLCSHLIYAFGVVGPDLTINLDASRFPAAPESVRILNNLKTVNRDLVTLISLGGASLGAEAFVVPAADESSRTSFAQNSVRFCRENNFDGVDIDWEYPENGTSFTLMIQALRTAFDRETVPPGKKRLLLTAAVSVAGEKISTIYDVPALNSALDFFNVMAYDFHGSWSKISSFNSPLYPRKSNRRFQQSLNAEWAVTQYINKGASRSKIILGLASYGRAYQLTDRTQHGVGVPIEASSVKGPVLVDGEYRMYPEVCDFINTDRARYHFDEEQKSAFAYTIDFWIGFDDPRAFQVKTQYAIDQQFGGVLVWTLDYDDVSGNHCGFGPFPLTRAIKYTIEGKTSLIPQKPLRLYQPILNLPQPAPSNERYKRVCYFTNWSTKRDADKGLFTTTNIDMDTCTHVAYAFAFVDEVGHSILPLYPNEESKSESEPGLMEKFNSIKRYNPKIRTLLSVGGETAGTTAFQIVSQDDNSRRAFARNVLEYLQIWGFDGIDLVWIYPESSTKSQFALLLQAMREEFNRYEAANDGAKMILSISVSGENPQIQNAYEIPTISRYVDFLNLLAYTYARTDNRTYFVSPLRKSSTDPVTAQLNQEWSVSQWLAGGASAEKIVLGLTGIGRSFELNSTTKTAPGSPFISQDVRGPVLGEKGIMLQYEVCDFLNRGAEEMFDSEQVAAYAYSENLWVSYENIKSIEEKVNWLKSRGLAGFSFWTLDYDDYTGDHCNCGRFPLLTAAYKTVKGLPVPCIGWQTPPGAVNDGSPSLKPVTTPEPAKTTKQNIFVVVDRNNTSKATISILLVVILQIIYWCR